MILLASATVFYFLLHSLLVDSGVKARLAGRLIKAPYYRLVYNVVAAGGLVVIAWLYITTEKHPIGPAQLHSVYARAAGILLLLAGVVIGLAAFARYDSAEFLGLRQLKSARQEPEQLNTQGLNAVVRHPLYLATLLVLWGWLLLSPFDAVLLLAILGSAYLYVGARLEEQKLVATFGEAYRQYQQQVPMLLPRLTKRKKIEKK